jgi:ribose transport system permease protein
MWAKRGSLSGGEHVQPFSRKLFETKEITAVGLIVLVIVILAACSRTFLTWSNVDSLQTSIAPNAIIATGMMILLIGGVFDLSVGSVMGLAGVITSFALVGGVPVVFAILIGVAVGVAAGFINGVLIALVGVNPLIATFGMMQVGRGLVFVLLEGTAKHGVRGFGEQFIRLGAGRMLGVYNMVWVMLIIVVVAQILTSKAQWGRHIYFVGGNQEAARSVGIQVKRVRVLTYTLSGLLAALAGILVTARLEMASRYLGSGLEMRIIISCLIGGGSISGGQGSVLGAFFGVVFMSLLANSFTIMQIGDFWQNIIIGLILIVVVSVDAYLYMRNLKERGKL